MPFELLGRYPENVVHADIATNPATPPELVRYYEWLKRPQSHTMRRFIIRLSNARRAAVQRRRLRNRDMDSCRNFLTQLHYRARLFRLIDIQDDIESEPRSGWSWVGVQRVDDAIVGVVDWAIENQDHELLLLVSVDQGETFRLRSMVKKPHYMATFKAFSALANGAFELVIALDDCADCGVPLGTYRYRSDDGGRSWKNSGYTQ